MIKKSVLLDKIVTLATKVDEQQSLINFLCNHDKNDIVIEKEYTFRLLEIKCCAKFLYYNKIKSIELIKKIQLPIYDFDEYVITSNDSEQFIIKFIHKETQRYFKVIKRDCSAMEVTEIFENKPKESEDNSNNTHTKGEDD